MSRWLGIAMICAVAGCSKPAPAPPPDPTATVRTAPAIIAAIGETLTAYGAAEFDPAAMEALTSPFEAQVSEVHVAVGQAVRAGDPIVSLAPSATTRLELDRLAREASQAARDYARLRRLRADGLASDAEVEAARSAASTAAAVSRSLQARAAGGVLRAKRAAVVDTLSASPGALLAAGAPVATLGATSRLNARLGLEVEDAKRLRVGAPVVLEGMHEGGARLDARVASVDRRVDAGTRLAAALVDLPPAGPFLPGETLRAEIGLGVRSDATVIPRRAVLYEGERPFTFVVLGGKAVRRDLRLGVEQSDRVQIVSGLRSGERVVVEGGASLAPGMAVKDVSATPAVAGARP